MLFNSIHFIVFFTVVTTLYFLILHRYRWLLLLLSSCYFYMAFVPVYILILGTTIIIDYYAGIYLERTKGKRRRYFLVASLSLIHISEPTRLGMISYAVFCLKKK